MGGKGKNETIESDFVRGDLIFGCSDIDFSASLNFDSCTRHTVLQWNAAASSGDCRRTA